VSTSHDPETGNLERKARALFDESVERLDGRTRSRLTQARNRAVDELRNGAVRRRWLRSPIGGLAVAAVAAVIVVVWTDPFRSGDQTGVLPLEDIDIVADSESLEMLEDMEFYVWVGDAASDRHSG
jgi:hypothetical protein